MKTSCGQQKWKQFNICLQLLAVLVHTNKKEKNIQTNENVGTNKKKGFIQLNRLSSGYKGTGCIIYSLKLHTNFNVIY